MHKPAAPIPLTFADVSVTIRGRCARTPAVARPPGLRGIGTDRRDGAGMSTRRALPRVQPRDRTRAPAARPWRPWATPCAPCPAIYRTPPWGGVAAGRLLQHHPASPRTTRATIRRHGWTRCQAAGGGGRPGAHRALGPAHPGRRRDHRRGARAPGASATIPSSPCRTRGPPSGPSCCCRGPRSIPTADASRRRADRRPARADGHQRHHQGGSCALIHPARSRPIPPPRPAPACGRCADDGPDPDGVHPLARPARW